MIAAIVILSYILYMITLYDKALLMAAVQDKRNYKDNLLFVGLFVTLIIAILMQIKFA